MPHYLTSKGPASINYGLMGLRLPSGKEVVFTTHAEKNWDSYLLLFAIALTVGWFQLIQPIFPSDGVLRYVYYSLPVIANAAIYFFGYYIEALKQDPKEFRAPGSVGSNEENYFEDGSKKPTHVQFARNNSSILIGPAIAWAVGFVIAAFWPTVRSWYYRL